MKRLLSVAVILSAGLLVGCEKEPKTVQYYLDNPDAMNTTLADCDNRAVSPFGDSLDSQNCRAAADAKKEQFFKQPKAETQPMQEQQQDGKMQEQMQ